MNRGGAGGDNLYNGNTGNTATTATPAILRSLLAGAVMVTAALAMPVASSAASPEDDYFAARDAYIKKFKVVDDAGPIGDAAMKEHDSALAELAKQMRAIVGPVAIKGLTAPATINLSTLFPSDMGFGVLDGMLYASADDKTRIIVTTAPIFESWLRAHKEWLGDKTASVPQVANDALASETFFNQAIRTDAAVMRFAPITLAKPATATFVYAMLAARSQDNSPPTPDEIFVALVQSGRVYVANSHLQTKFKQIPACDDVRKEQEKKAAAADKKDEKQIDASIAMHEQADVLFLKCFAARAAAQPAFAAASKQAQALLESLPSR